MTDLLIIGKNGQLGNELMLAAQKLNISAIGYGREELDVTDTSKIIRIINKDKPQTIINTSAYHVVPSCEINPGLAFEVNCIAVRNLAKLCEERDVTFVTFSTDYVFDGKKGKPYMEEDKPNPLQMYGLSKLAGEYAALYTHPKGTYVIRTCGVYGGKKGSRSKKGNFVLNIMEEAKRKDVLEVSSEQIVNPTYAKDLAIATLSLLGKNPGGGIYHLANEGYSSWYEFAKKILEYAKIEKKILPVDRGGKSGDMLRPKFSALLNNKAKKLGIVLPNLNDSLKKYIENINN